MMLYRDTKAMLHSTYGDSDSFKIVPEVYTGTISIYN